MHVLICDDDSTTRFVMRRLLEQNFGCRVSECADGVEALQLLERGQYSFLLLDVEMPTMDGFDTLEEIRQAPKTAEMPVIILSCLRDESGVMRLIQLGVSDYILKPIRNDSAVAKIAQVVRMLPPMETQRPDVAAIRLSATTPAMLIDGNLDFRFYFVNQAQRYGPIMQADSGAAGIAQFRRSPVDLVFVGGDLGLVSGERVVKKLRELRSESLRIVRLADPSEDVDALGMVYDGVVVRSYVADVMRAALRPYVFVPGVLHELSTLVPELPDMLTSAARQVFGMMFDAEVTPAELRGPREVAFSSRLEIVLNERFVMQLGVHLGRPAGLAVTSKMFSMPAADLVDEDCLSTAGELGNLLTGRIHARFLERALKSVCGLPVIDAATVLPVPDDAVGLLRSYAIPNAGDFHISLTVQDRLVDATAQTAEAAPAAAN